MLIFGHSLATSYLSCSEESKKHVSFSISSFMRKAIQDFLQSWGKVWNLWEIRVTVILSLILQIILILLGNKRKVSTSTILRITLWLAYNTADSLATVSLSILTSNGQESIALWAPFLLLHLGGPDTITAYSLEDNDLWLRHLLQLGVQIGVALYVLLNAWISDAFNFMAIPIFIAGIIKCGERIWALWHVSRGHFRESLLPAADPGPNYARYMEDYKSKKDEGFDVSLGKLIESQEAPTDQETTSNTGQRTGNFPMETEKTLQHAENFFGIFKRLFADLILSFDDIQKSQSFFRSRTYEQAFEVIEIELGFTYDLFYTKAVLVYSLAGVVLRCITFFCSVSVLCSFLVVKKEAFSKSDVIITYLLLIGAIVMEILAVSTLLFSDWAIIRLGKFINRVASIFPKRWSNSMAQYNIIKLCLKKEPTKCRLIQKTVSIYKLFEMHRHKEMAAIPDKFKELIFHEFKQKLEDVPGNKDCRQYCACRGNWVLKKENLLGELEWSIGAEFDQSILLWHIATDLCYYEDMNSEPNSVGNEFSHRESSRLLSNYMVYLLVMCPFMLPSGIGQIRLRDTCAEATEFFREIGPISKENEACTMLLKVCTEIPPSEVKGDRCKSVLFEGCRLAKELQSLERKPEWKREQKWELISRVWIEMLSHAASQCKWTDHAQQLRRGGELLTHVWLLMAHLGFTEQFQVSQGHARVKLIIQ